MFLWGFTLPRKRKKSFGTCKWDDHLIMLDNARKVLSSIEWDARQLVGAWDAKIT